MPYCMMKLDFTYSSQKAIPQSVLTYSLNLLTFLITLSARPGTNTKTSQIPIKIFEATSSLLTEQQEPRFLERIWKSHKLDSLAKAADMNLLMLGKEATNLKEDERRNK